MYEHAIPTLPSVCAACVLCVIARGNFDPDGNGLVTPDEMAQGLDNIGCFGPFCPFGSKNSPEQFMLGLGSQIQSTGIGQLSFTQFVTNLLATNYSQWVSDCPTSVTVTTSGMGRAIPALSPPYTGPTINLLQSNTAAVYVQLKQTYASTARCRMHVAFSPWTVFVSGPEADRVYFSAVWQSCLRVSSGWVSGCGVRW